MRETNSSRTFGNDQKEVSPVRWRTIIVVILLFMLGGWIGIRLASDTNSQEVRSIDSAYTSPAESSRGVPTWKPKASTVEAPEPTNPADPPSEPTPAIPLFGASFDSMFKPVFVERPALQEVQEPFTKEPRDRDWAPVIEEMWRSAWNRNIELNQYARPEVLCKQTQCQVRVFTPVPVKISEKDWKWLLFRGVPTNRRLVGENVNYQFNVSMDNLAFAESEGGLALIYHIYYQRPKVATSP